MPKPESVTQADIERWHKNLVEAAATDLSFRFILNASGDLVERAWYTGCWLGERLAEDRCSKTLASVCMRLHARRANISSDPWATAQEIFADYMSGEIDATDIKHGGLTLVSYSGESPSQPSRDNFAVAARVGEQEAA